MADPPLPTLHQLRAAHQTARALHCPRTSLADARRSFGSLPSDGAFGSRDFDAGERILRALGLISLDGNSLLVSKPIEEIAALSSATASYLLLDLIFERQAPSWLAIAAGREKFVPGIIPERDLATISSVIIDPDLREALLLHAGRRHNAQALAALGAIGEEYVFECCRAELRTLDAPNLAAQVARVSLVSDQLGYDILAPRLDGSPRRLEVKTTRRLRWRGEVFISRNEFETGLRDSNWALVVVEIGSDGKPFLAGWCPAKNLAAILPGDRHPHARWASASLQEIVALLEPGLPPH